MSEIYADSGELQDIQIAVNSASIGDTVFIPEGVFDSIVDPNSIGPNNNPFGVLILGGINIVGQGENRTVLKVPYELPYASSIFLIDGRNGYSQRTTGIGFENFVETTEDTSPSAIVVLGANNYRVDHCRFWDWTGSGVEPINYYPPYGVNRGVIDHCEFDNPYKDTFWNNTGEWPYWGYGVHPVGTFYNWVQDINNILGRYDIPNVAYIENCTFRRCRHGIASIGGAHYVARYNYFTEMILAHYGSYVDAHGTTRLIEVYDNLIENVAIDYRSTSDERYWGQYMGLGINPRGGAGVIFNNTLKNFVVGGAIQLSNDQANEQYRLNEVWIWDNIFTNVQTELDINEGSFPIVEGEQYFLHEKLGYTPYPYPHPLVSGIQVKNLIINSNIDRTPFNMRRIG